MAVAGASKPCVWCKMQGGRVVVLHTQSRPVMASVDEAVPALRAGERVWVASMDFLKLRYVVDGQR